ncbi:MAG: hypothetical protein IJZ80_05645, partial [Clostridia bacterium]|nr:hypothetical protein [Clostridia bacterium]
MNDTTVWCQNASVTEPQRELLLPKTNAYRHIMRCSSIVTGRRGAVPYKACALSVSKSNTGEQAGSRWSLTAIGRFYRQRTDYANP